MLKDAANEYNTNINFLSINFYMFKISNKKAKNARPKRTHSKSERVLGTFLYTGLPGIFGVSLNININNSWCVDRHTNYKRLYRLANVLKNIISKNFLISQFYNS